MRGLATFYFPWSLKLHLGFREPTLCHTRELAIYEANVRGPIARVILRKAVPSFGPSSFQRPQSLSIESIRPLDSSVRALDSVLEQAKNL
jgi:hypothetical protein